MRVSTLLKIPPSCGMAARMAPIRILVADDFRAWRRLVSLMIKKSPDLRVVGEASDGLEAVQKAEKIKPDLILLDIGLPKLNGIEAGRLIRQNVPDCKIVFLTLEYDLDVVRSALDMGARGYVRKSVAASELIPAVKAAVKNGSGLPIEQSGI
jgi:DNA-binding NarL/FixJ family response regulator